MIELLLERGANPTHRNAYGVVISAKAERDGVDPVLRALVRRAVERRG